MGLSELLMRLVEMLIEFINVIPCRTQVYEVENEDDGGGK